MTNQSSKHIKIVGGQRLGTDGQWHPSSIIRIVDGRIVAIDDDVSSQDVNSESVLELDASGCLIIPGLIDLNVALREPGATRNGTIATETLAAASSGITRLCCCPDTSPVNDSKAVTQLILERTESVGACKVLPLGALTKNLQGEQLAGYAALKDAGCVGLSNGFNPLKDLLVTQRCFEYAKSLDMTVMINPIEPSLYQGFMHEGDLSTQLGIKAVPSYAETIAVAQLIELARHTGVRLHLSQLSTAGSVDLVRSAKDQGHTVTCDVAIGNLLYIDQDVGYFDSLYHAMPPFRTSTDRAALLAGLQDDTIDAITSAHRPWEAAEKKRPFAETKAGLSTIEYLLPLSQTLASSGIDNKLFFSKMTAGPARVLQQSLPAITLGDTADLFVYGKSNQSPDTAASLGANVPRQVSGNVSTLPLQPGGSLLTICEGKVSYLAPKLTGE